ncbi:hypothetical protein QUF64_14825 [Anaerolineales bacterium HSG6]|nr:hypothetical protein [Anaerolineales bacterium HSG6]
MNLGEPIEVTQQIAQTFERLTIPYLVGGSLASSLHGIPRATQDVDIVADIKLNQVASIVEALKDGFYIDADIIREAIRNCSSFNIIHLATMFKVDIFVLKPDHTSQQEMIRREQYQLSDNPLDQLYLATAEDVIVHKLYWYQMSGSTSERQWNDVLGVIQVQSDQLDYTYLKQTAQQRGVSELLEKILQDAAS